MHANPDATAQIMGEVMHAAGLAQILCFAFARQNPEMKPRIEAGIDNLLFQRETIAANPDHGVPGSLAYARHRLEEFLAEFQELTRV